MAVSGSQKTRIGGALSGVGIVLTITAKSPGEAGTGLRIIMQMLNQYDGGQTVARVGKQ